MKKQQLTKALGALCLCFAVAGGVSAVTASATGEGVVSIENGVLKIDGTEVTAASANFKTWEKASVRYDSATDSLGNEYTGMRFLSWLNDEVYEALMASSDYTVSFGTLIASESTVTTATAFTKEGLPQNTASATYYKDVACTNIVAAENEKSGQTSVTEFSAIIYGTSSEAKFAEQRMARAYMTVTSVEDATKSVTLYADYNAEESRSIADVAMGALQANEYKTAAEDAEEKEFKALTKYAKASSQWKTGYDYMRYIKTWDELKAYAANEGTYIVMKNDIDLSGVTASDWSDYNKDSNTPVAVIQELNATLDGNNKKLYGLTYTEKKNSYSNIGFFGKIGANATVRNLIFDGDIGAVDENGYPLNVVLRGVGLFAYYNAGTIENCYVTGKIITNTALADYDNSVGNRTVGMVYKNSGTIQNVISNIYFSHSQSTTSTQKVAVEDNRRYAFAVSNALDATTAGTVKDSVSVSEMYTTKQSSYGVRSWTTSGIYSEVAKGATDADVTAQKEAGTYTFGDNLTAEQYPVVPDNYSTVATQGDANRSGCLIFDSFADLLAGNGYSDAWTAFDYSDNAPAYVEVTAVNALETLGSAWYFDTELGIVKLGGADGTAVYYDTSLDYANGKATWGENGTATILLDGEQIGTTESKSYDLGSYFSANAATLGAGEKAVTVQVTNGGETVVERKGTVTLAMPTTLAELKEAAANKYAYIYLTQDIDLSGVTKSDWTGDSKTAPVAVIQELNATLDGNGHKLYGLTLTEKAGGTTNIGFIGTVNADVRNLIFDGSIGGVDEETGYTLEVALRHVGLFAWYNAATIENCYVTGTVTTYRDSGGNGDFTVGMVYKNAGTIKNVLSNVRWLRGKTSEAPKENFMRYAFAVSNALDEKRAGSVENCVSVNEAYESTKKYVVTSGSGKYVRAWTTSAIYSEVAKNATNADGVKYYTFGNGYSSEIYPVVYDNYQQVFSQYDANRSGCLIFETFNGLLNGSGWSDDCTPNHESPVEADEYTAVSGADVQATLGSAWTVDSVNGVIKLGDTVIYQKVEA